MKKLKAAPLLEELKANTRQIILQLNYLVKEEESILVQQPAVNKWSVAQVLEHLNAYGRYYLPEIESAIHKNPVKKIEYFKPGWVGDYFTKMMQPKENGQIKNKMKAMKDYRPSVNLDSKAVIDESLAQHQFLLQLLEAAEDRDISSIRIPVSLSRWIRLKLGDTFRFLIAHEQRHFIQIDNTLAALKPSIQRKTSNQNV